MQADFVCDQVHMLIDVKQHRESHVVQIDVVQVDPNRHETAHGKPSRTRKALLMLCKLILIDMLIDMKQHTESHALHVLALHPAPLQV